MNDFGIIVGIVWILILATAALVFRRRVVGLLLQFTVPERSEEDRRRELGIGVALLCAFAYVLGAVVLAQLVLPSPASGWALGVGLAICVLLNIMYWIRFQNAGLSVLGRQRRRP